MPKPQQQLPKKGEEFHRLVEMIERAVSLYPNTQIESPGFLPDKISGTLREFDVLLTQQLPHRKIVTAVECRDRGRRITVGQIEEFARKCQDCAVDKGVMVSSSGFVADAKKRGHFTESSVSALRRFKDSSGSR